MRMFPFALAIAATGLLAACETQGTRRIGDLTQSDLNTGLRIAKADPTQRQWLVHQCRADQRMQSRRQNANLAVLMNVTPAQAPAVYCDRLIKGLESGRITAADLNAGTRGMITPPVLAVLQGE
ncbi:hypothetical protein [Paracoccus sp. (in: a-proteobacteria)]|uniref:hypothetical protein n=1 Tax=Paracoccus sp. TaxID=267 RepID=UPI0035B3F7C5